MVSVIMLWSHLQLQASYLIYVAVINICRRSASAFNLYEKIHAATSVRLPIIMCVGIVVIIASRDG